MSEPTGGPKLNPTGIIRTTIKPFSAKFGVYDKALSRARDEIELAFKVASEKGSLRDRQEASLFRFQGRQHWNYEIEQLSRMEREIGRTSERTVQAIGHCGYSFSYL